jgi:uncharacterized membrane protein (UPF0127 family)
MRALTALFALALAACSPQPAVETGTVPQLDGAFGFDSLQVIDDQGESHTFDVYLATTPEQQRRGLMFVRQMPASTGMLFIYDGEDYRSMWMKNTYIPLDMVFARGDGSVSSIITNTVPQTLKTQASVEPVTYVLELNGGTTRRLGIGTRSRLVVNLDE